MSKVISLTFINDPGHGWLGVPMKFIHELECKNCFSKYSYFEPGRGIAWLEEDCDAAIFVMKAEQAGYEIKINDVYVEDTYVRSLKSYPFMDRAEFDKAMEESSEHFS